MRLAVMTGPGKIEFKEVQIPEINRSQVRIKVQCIGVCGSDIHVFHGKHPFVSYPLIQGHEFFGIIEAVGDDVKSVSVGDKVTATPQEVCGKCAPCERGQNNACQELKVRGFQAPGCAQDYFVTEEEKVVKLPDDFSQEQGAFVEPVAVAAHSTSRSGDLTGKNVVVTGAGTIGNFVAQACKSRGAKKVLITDISDFRLKKAESVGLHLTCNVNKESLEKRVIKEFGDKGFDVGFEVAGVQSSLSSLVNTIGKGGTVLIIGVYAEHPKVDMSVVCEHELNLKGSMMYRYDDWIQAVKWINSEEVKTKPLVTEHYSFENYLKAYKFIEEKGEKSMKVMIDL